MVIEEFGPGELTVPGAAHRANIPESQVRYYLQTGQLAFVRRWGRVVIGEEDLMRLVETRVTSLARPSRSEAPTATVSNPHKREV